MAKHSKRLIALILAIVMVLGIAIPAGAATNSDAVKLPYSESSITPDPRLPQLEKDEDAAEVETPADDEIFRVSIILEDDSTLDKGYATYNIANNKSAIKYRDSLEAKQEKVEATIEKEVLGGEDLDVVWNLTLAANLISANVEYGQIEEIKEIKGVKDVVIEVQYAPAVTDDNLPVDPQMSTSSVQIGSGTAWADGYTGAGSTVAIIDTGIDDDHQSFDADAFDYAIAKVIESGKEVDLMDVSDIEKVFDQLNIVKFGDYTGDASGLYLNTKIPFAFNYVDGDLDINHDNDGQGEHGSHVTGIAAANRYIKDGEDYVDALTSVFTQGVAPDAQIITMKVFGKGGGAYDSDYMAAIEDALVLGADTVNLSLGSSVAGLSRSDAYEYILDKLVESDTVVTISAGNNGYWSENSYMPYLYGDDINFQTGGSPGSYTNSLGVASVDNVGTTAGYLQLGDRMIFYTETGIADGVKAMSTLAGEQTYVFLDAFAAAGDFDGIDVRGKIAVVWRGQENFTDKGNRAAAAGAAAIIVANNAPGTISMSTDGYTANIPYVSITQEDGYALMEAATGFDTSAKNIDYYTGTITIGDGVASSEAEKNEDGIYTMSDFSSWGVPGSLTMKPEITAPGGNIYSVNGLIPGGEAYENMSGTSMAAPQVSGMAAVVAQYIRENADRFADVELTTRGLINSLLMATAEPIVEEASGSYYSILAQGSGLANVGNAISADAYIVMGDDATASAADGKVKVELGDDPAKEGVYTYNFTINNTSGTENVYTLDTTLFTQDLFTDSGYLLLDTWTTPINADVTYTVDGAPFDVDARIDADVNMDGYTDADDAQAILDYIVGNIPKDELNQYKFEVGDIDGDGKITTYDAHLILAGIEARLTVPANGSVEVEVTATIAKEDLSAYVNGAYIEGYTFVNPVASEEGELDVVYSIPVLGFYGNWSDPSMFDRLTVEGFVYGSDHDIPYTGEITDELDYRDGDDKQTYYLFGNPYGDGDEEYHPEREALRSKDTLTAYYYSLIRNAGARLAVIYDSKGNVVYSTSVSSEYAAYYYDSVGAWYSTYSGVNLGVKVADLNTKNDEQFTFEMYAIPEYYLTDEMYEDGVITLEEALSVVDQLGHGAVVSKSITVDDKAPEFIGAPMKSSNGDLTIKVKDNQYIAYAVALNRSGTMMFANITADDLGQTKAGEEVELVFSAEDLAGASEWVAIAVYDYAGNMRVIEAQYGEHVDREGKMYGFTSGLFGNSSGALNTWLELDPATVNITATADAGYELEDLTTFVVASAEYIDGYVFQADANGNLYVAPDSDFGMTTLIGNMGIAPVDMAYDTEGNALYALVQTGTNTRNAMFTVYEINPLTARVSAAFTVDAKNGNTYSSLYGMAIDDEGTFYFDSTNLYVASGWNGEDTTVTPDRRTGSLGNYRGVLAWDHNTDTLYMVSKATAGNNNNYLAKVDTEAGTTTRANGTNTGSQLYAPFTALFVAPGLIEGKDFDPTDVVEDITLSSDEITIVKGTSYRLEAILTPWTLSDKDVTWSSSDEKVAVVDELGYVTGVGNGSATITATTNAKDSSGNSLTATCDVEVVSIELELNGLVWDESGDVWWSEINTAKLPEYKKLNSTPTNNEGLFFSSAAVDLWEEVLFAATWDGETVVDATSDIYVVDPTTFESEFIATSNGQIGALPFTDMADTLGIGYDLYVAGKSGSYVAATYGPYVLLVNTETGEYESVIWASENNTNLVGIAFAGNGTYSGLYYDIYYMMDIDGNLHMTAALYGDLGSGEGFYTLSFNGLGADDVVLSTGISTDVPYFNSLYYYFGDDTNYTVWSRYSASENDVDIILIDDSTDEIYEVGSFDEGVWPVGGLVTLADASNTLNSFARTDAVASVTKVKSDVNVARVALSESAIPESKNVAADEQIPVTGSLNAVSLTSGETEGKEKQNVIVDTEANTVTVKVYAEDSTNALLSVNYDADIFALESVDGLTKYNAYNSDTAGKVAFDFAAAGALTQKVAEVVLSYDEEDEKNINTEIIVTVEEESENVDLNEKEIIPIDLTEVEEPETPDAPKNPTSPITGAEAGLLATFMMIVFIGCGMLSVYPAKRRRKSIQK